MTGLSDSTGTVNYSLSGGGGSLTAAVSANTIQFTGAANTITVSGASALSLNGVMNAGSGLATIADGSLIIGAGRELVFTGQGNMAVAAAVQDNGSGASAVTMAGGGTLVLSGTNTYSGSTLVSSGTLVLANSGALQQSTLDATEGVVSFGSLTSVTLGGLAGPGTLVLANTSSKAVALSVGSNNASATYSGALQGAGSLTKIGSGLLVLAGANSYSGATTIGAGTLQVGNGGPSGTLGSGAVIDDSALVFDLAGTSTFARRSAAAAA